MAEKDTYSALWVSYSSINTYLSCPKAYYWSSVYRNPATNKKISLMAPALALGQAVHEVVESLSVIPVEKRLLEPLTDRLERVWKKVAGERGGFESAKQEAEYKDRARVMLTRVNDHPGPVARLAVKIRQELPHFWLSDADEIVMCGRIDWLEYLPDTDSVHIIDFKTGKKKVNEGSKQLSMYQLLARKTQVRPVTKVSYWYLEHNDELTEKEMVDTDELEKEILKVAKEMKLRRKLNKLDCPTNGCSYCRPYETVVQGKAKLVGLNDFGQELYVVKRMSLDLASDIL